MQYAERADIVPDPGSWPAAEIAGEVDNIGVEVGLVEAEEADIGSAVGSSPFRGSQAAPAGLPIVRWCFGYP